IGINTADYDYVVKVTGISDGDTFKGLTNDLEEIKFRLYGIDAPEKRQSFGKKSQEYLSDLIFNKKVGIKIQKEKDAYGRPVVWVYTPDGKDVSAEMLKAGMAWHFKRYDSSPEYAAYEQKAQQEKKGLWIDSHAIPPWEFRKKEK
ncbi:thermonuclease family protein, partial [Bacteroidales bacterium OttesenSCG-928-M06]|nr:thermonuclease family protein [Bacteroidales bacterium OttesenSCG-928-M06]